MKEPQIDDVGMQTEAQLGRPRTALWRSRAAAQTRPQTQHAQVPDSLLQPHMFCNDKRQRPSTGKTMHAYKSRSSAGCGAVAQPAAVLTARLERDEGRWVVGRGRTLRWQQQQRTQVVSATVAYSSTPCTRGMRSCLTATVDGFSRAAAPSLWLTATARQAQHLAG
jgi:hypothetical protein